MNTCSNVAFCVSPHGEKNVKRLLHEYSTRLGTDELSELHRAYYGPSEDPDIEIHDKEKSMLRTWSRCKWGNHWVVARFTRWLMRKLDKQSYFFIRLGSEELHDSVSSGSYFDNPFRLWAQRRFVFIDNKGVVRSTLTEQMERDSFAQRTETTAEVHDG
jgi:hypothetical protein